MTAAATVDAPPLDTVLAWVTNKVERDYEARGLFPQLRHALAMRHVPNAGLHYLTPQQAEAVLADAQQAAATHGVRGMKFAYRCHAESLQQAIEHAAKRPAEWGGPGPVNVWQDECSECWRGTKAQLLAHGIQVDGPWPGEPGNKSRAATGRDARGHQASVTRCRHRASSLVWPGQYEAIIRIRYPAAAVAPAPDEAAIDAGIALCRLRQMPGSADEFRGHLVSSLRSLVRVSIDIASNPRQMSHGYQLEDAQGIHEAFDAIADAVMAAPVKFLADRHAEIAQGLRATIAAGDSRARAKVAELCKPNPSILAGGMQ